MTRVLLLCLLVVTTACAATPVQVERTGVETPLLPIEASRTPASSGRPDESRAYVGHAWDPGYFDALLPSRSLEVEGLRHRHVREGVGIPLVGVRSRGADDPFYYPPEGITRALTAVTVRDDRGVPSVRLLDPARVASVAVDGVSHPLAADFTAPYAVLLSRTRFEHTAILGAFDHQEIAPQAGIFLLEPYDPDRIPLLLVHGLLSSPLTWMELHNELLGDPLVRERYQVWHAVYPTGIPFLHAAADFRQHLARLRAALDPEGDDFATGHLVVVSHSKGGLLTKTLVTTTGEALWDRAFTVPPEALDASPVDLAAMEDFLVFERDPGVRRVVFIATPHRGSGLADSAVAELAASWVTLPDRDAETFERVLRDNAEHLHPDFRFRLAGLPAGPQALSTRDPLIRAMADLPIDPSVPFHTILGEPEPGLFSDGVVEHASSRQEGAVSELVVPGEGHGVHASPAAIAEVQRILREHLEGLRAAPLPAGAQSLSAPAKSSP